MRHTGLLRVTICLWFACYSVISVANMVHPTRQSILTTLLFSFIVTAVALVGFGVLEDWED